MTTSTTAPSGPPSRAARVLRALEVPIVLAVPVGLAVAFATDVDQSALLSLAVVTASLALFLCGYEADRPGLRQIMPTLVLAACAAAGRILFAPVPDFKPASAIVVIAGAALGRREGFMAGALTALTSNFFFGQGMWTPWQMYAWGLVGYLSGVLARAHVLDRRPLLLAWGFLSAFVYGLVLNSYQVIGFVKPFTVPGAIASFAAAFPFDLVHALATVLFLAVLYRPWMRRIGRVVERYGL